MAKKNNALDLFIRDFRHTTSFGYRTCDLNFSVIHTDGRKKVRSIIKKLIKYAVNTGVTRVIFKTDKENNRFVFTFEYNFD